jgi:hypothetical protein
MAWAAAQLSQTTRSLVEEDQGKVIEKILLERSWES